MGKYFSDLTLRLSRNLKIIGALAIMYALFADHFCGQINLLGNKLPIGVASVALIVLVIYNVVALWIEALRDGRDFAITGSTHRQHIQSGISSQVIILTKAGHVLGDGSQQRGLLPGVMDRIQHQIALKTETEPGDLEQLIVLEGQLKAATDLAELYDLKDRLLEAHEPTSVRNAKYKDAYFPASLGVAALLLMAMPSYSAGIGNKIVGAPTTVCSATLTEGALEPSGDAAIHDSLDQP